MDLFDIAIARKLSGGGGGGGGGDSDFSTAQVTFSGLLTAPIYLAVAVEYEEDSMSAVGIDEEGTFSVILYKGMAYGYYEGTGTVVGTGGVSVENDGTIFVTGDGTITIS